MASSMSLQLPQLHISSVSSSSLTVKPFSRCYKPTAFHNHHHRQTRTRGRRVVVVSVGTNNKEDSVSVAAAAATQQEEELDESPEAQDLKYVREIQRVLDLLKKNRDMFYNEVKLTIMIEDPREVERRRLLGIEDPDMPTRDDLAEALDEVKEGKIPQNRFALQILAEEMTNWPNLEVEVKRSKPKKSLYAKATDTGVDPQVAAKRLNIDWDTAAEIEDSEESEKQDIPSIVGFGALYLVTALPVIIGVSVVLILFYNSLQ